MAATAPVLGIDFGTTDCKAALVLEGRLELLVDEGRSHVASAIHIPARGPLEVGARARGRAPARTVTSIKRVLGRKWSDPEVRAISQGVAYRLVGNEADEILVRMDDRDIAPVQLVAAVLAHLRDLAEQRAGTPVVHAVFSMPVNAPPGYPAALERAARLAGLEPIRLVHEPVAAAWGARLERSSAPRRVLVCDFGGGTFDTSLMLQDGGRLEVVGVAGDPFLGGDDLDTALANAVAGQVFRTERVELGKDVARWATVVAACEQVKRALTITEEAVLTVPQAYAKDGAWHDVSMRVSRSTIEPRWQPLVDRAIAVTMSALDAAKWPAALIDDLLLVGGTCQVPLVRRSLVRKINRQPSKIAASDVVVAAGLAMIGARALLAAAA